MTPKDDAMATPETGEKIEKTDEQWRQELTPEQYQVLRKHGTEAPFTGKYWKDKRDGTYVCAACGQELFKSETKFESGSGWPSFYEPMKKEAIGEQTDRSAFMERTEIHCSRCGGHLGHVFPDAPQTPTGLRYCVNSLSLKFKPKDGAPE